MHIGLYPVNESCRHPSSCMGLFKQLKPSVSLAIETESDQNKLRVRRIIDVLSFLLCKPLCVGNGGHEWASIPSTPTCIANSITWR